MPKNIFASPRESSKHLRYHAARALTALAPAKESIDNWMVEFDKLHHDEGCDRIPWMPAVATEHMAIEKLPLSRSAVLRGLAIAEALANRLEPLRNFLESVDLEPQLMELGIDPESITYLSKHFPLAFAKRFFWKNFTKCCVATSLVAPAIRSANLLVDLGCGPGTFIFPAATLAPKVPIIGVDHNPQQLALANTFIQKSSYKPAILIQADAVDDVLTNPGFFTASYLVTELDQRQRATLVNSIVESTKSSFLIVDYFNVVADLAKQVSVYRKCRWEAVSADLTSRLFTLVGDQKISFGILHVPARSTQAI